MLKEVRNLHIIVRMLFNYFCRLNSLNHRCKLLHNDLTWVQCVSITGPLWNQTDLKRYRSYFGMNSYLFCKRCLCLLRFVILYSSSYSYSRYFTILIYIYIEEVTTFSMVQCLLFSFFFAICRQSMRMVFNTASTCVPYALRIKFE